MKRVALMLALVAGWQGCSWFQPDPEPEPQRHKVQPDPVPPPPAPQG